MTNLGSVVFRFDAGLALGGGHAMRCLGLAHALRERGAAPVYAVRQSTLDTLPSLADGKVEILALDRDQDVDAMFVDGKTKADWLVVDLPGWDLGNAIAAHRISSAVAVISDAPARPLDCDVVLDTTAGRNAREYDGLVPEKCRIYTGPAYALLRPSFAALRHRSISAKKERRESARILIGFGATDPHGATLMALDAVELEASGAQVDIILGSSAPCLEEVRTRVAASQMAVFLHIDTPDVAGLMAGADFAIGAAGITSWERCSLGLPTIVITQADNQLQNAASLMRGGAAEVLGASDAVSVTDIMEAIGRMLAEPDYRHRMVDCAAVMCDGLGARRFAQVMFPECARDGAPVMLRPATLADMDILFDWQTHPDTRRYFRRTQAPSRCTHENWLGAKLADPDCVFGILEHNGTPAGVLRFDIVAENEPTNQPNSGTDSESHSYEVSILVAPDRWRLGIGAAALRLGRQLLPFATIRAAVDAENAASHRLFADAGYRRDGKEYVLGGDNAAVA